MPIRLATRWAGGQVVEAADFNEHISDPVDDLSGDGGIIEFRDGISVPAATGYVLIAQTLTSVPSQVGDAGTIVLVNVGGTATYYYSDGAAWRVLDADASSVTYENLLANGYVGAGRGSDCRRTA